MRTRLLFVLGAVLALLAVNPPAWAITNGVPDNGQHPYVGQLLFYVPDAVDPRFDDPGAWFTCTGTLVSSTIVVTAGHCTYAVGLEGESTTADGGDGNGGTDVWINFSEAPDYSILPASSTFAPDDNAGRYEAWSAALDTSPQWLEATAYSHPEYDDAQFFLHDLGVLVLDAPRASATYGELPELGLLDTLVKDQTLRFTPVGYGLEESGPKTALGGDTRRRATTKLVNLNGVFGAGKGVAAKFSANLGSNNTGGTCFGDSGGPIFLQGTTTIVAVTSFGISSTCTGSTGGYRLDQPDDLAWLATFGVS
ncbi:MAG TPA: trypsin-like serine protease [Mycobacteriales bacterium]|jgi:hypothetical protein|nr:trypsin-like serine protease [Mycobacteriales bacterium]